MKTAVLRIALFLACAVGTVHAAEFDRGLCDEDERVMFSCAVGDKIVSLCTLGSVGNPVAITYRYGTPDTLEIEHLASTGNTQTFAATTSTVGPHGSFVHQVWFDHGVMRYLLTECVGTDCPSRGGLAVLNADRVPMKSSCARDPRQHAWFTRGLVDFGDDSRPTTSATPLIVPSDEDNAVDRLYPALPRTIAR